MDRDNLIGVLFLIVMGALAVVLLSAIIAGERIQMSLNPVVSVVLGLAFFGLVIVGIVRSGAIGRFFGGRGGSQWPDPQTGNKSLWDRLRGK